MKSSCPSTEESWISLAGIPALLLIHIEQFIFIRRSCKAEAISTTSNSGIADSLTHTPLNTLWGKEQIMEFLSILTVLDLCNFDF